MKKVQNTPLNRLFLAINHYISTGDHLGEGIAYDQGTHVQVILAVNQSNPTDLADFVKFRSRFDELRAEFNLTLSDLGVQNNFHLHSFLVDLTDMDDLAKRLEEKPGAGGWGSMHELINQSQKNAR